MDKQTVQRRTRLTHPPYETIEFSSWTKLNRYLESIAWEWWLFRGQEDAEWPLTSSLTRELERRCIPPEQWRDKEERAIRIFRRKAHLLLQRPPTDLFEWIARMQHHSASQRSLHLIGHFVNVALLFSGAFVAWTFWREPGAWRWCVVSVAAVNVVAWLAFIYMHATGVLVGYDEFIRHRKGQ